MKTLSWQSQLSLARWPPTILPNILQPAHTDIQRSPTTTPNKRTLDNATEPRKRLQSLPSAPRVLAEQIPPLQTKDFFTQIGPSNRAKIRTLFCFLFISSLLKVSLEDNEFIKTWMGTIADSWSSPEPYRALTSHRHEGSKGSVLMRRRLFLTKKGILPKYMPCIGLLIADILCQRHKTGSSSSGTRTQRIKSKPYPYVPHGL